MHSRVLARDLLLAHVARYPRLDPQDIYKFAHQGASGPEHAVGAGDAVRRLNAEIVALREAELEPMLERLPPDGLFVRVHLRPFLVVGGEPAKLAAAFVRSAAPVAERAARLESVWNVVTALADDGLLPFGANEARDFFASCIAAEFPATSHSAKFHESYFPAYRVIRATEMETLRA